MQLPRVFELFKRNQKPSKLFLFALAPLGKLKINSQKVQLFSMDSLLQKISELFHNFTSPIAAVVYSPKNVENAQETQTTANQIPEASSQETGKPDSDRTAPDTTEPLTSGDIPTPDVKLQKFREQTAPALNYELEFVDFVDRNAPQGLSKKIIDILPYLEVSFLSWPAFWIWRGYNWQSARKTERIAFYIQRV